jgi:hypothetical protein
MGKLYWCRATDGSYDTRQETRGCRSRSRYNAALLVTRLADALTLGSSAVDEDRMIGGPFHFYKAGRGGMFYIKGRSADLT